MISLKHKFLFIHIPKTAGNAIQNILRKYSEEKIVALAPHQDGIERFEIRSDDYVIRKHASLAEYREQLGAQLIDSCFKFTCVRNPWDRLISFYFSPHRGNVSWNRRQFIDLLKEVKPITNFISVKRTDVLDSSCFRNMDFYMRYENLDEDFALACQRMNLPCESLPLRNASIREHYLKYYDHNLTEMVQERYAEEIRYFGYRFR